MINIEFTPGNVKAATKDMKGGEFWNAPYELLYVPPGFNIRENRPDRRAHIDNLKVLIKANGYDRSKTLAGFVTKVDGVDRIAVTDGENRYIAVGELREEGVEILTLPIITSVRGTSMEDLVVSLATSNSGLALTPYELGSLCKRLIGFGWDEPKVAEKLNISVSYVADLLFLQGCPAAVRDLVRFDKVSAGPAIDAVKKHGEKAIDVLMNAVEKAEASGKTKATAKHLEPTWASVMKKSGPKFHEAVLSIREDDGYKHLTAGTRKYLDDLLASLPPEPVK